MYPGEYFNSISHLVGAALAIAALTVLALGTLLLLASFALLGLAEMARRRSQASSSSSGVFD